MISMQTPFLSYIWLAILVCLATCNHDLSNGVNPFDINFFKVKRKNSKLFFADPFLQKSPIDNLTRSDFYLNSIMSDSFNNNERFKNPIDDDNLNSRLTASNSMTTSSSQSSSILINNLNSMKSEKYIDYIKPNPYNHFINRPNHNANNEINYQHSYEDLETSLECKLKFHKFKAINTDDEGRRCWGIVRLQVCWGRCDTGEYPDYRFPYKKSFHHVCIHREMRIKTALLKYCDPGVDESLKIYSYIDAKSCACAPCSSSEISCEGTDYLATTAPFR